MQNLFFDKWSFLTFLKGFISKLHCMFWVNIVSTFAQQVHLHGVSVALVRTPCSLYEALTYMAAKLVVLPKQVLQLINGGQIVVLALF